MTTPTQAGTDWVATLEDGSECAVAQRERKRRYTIAAPPVQIVEWRRSGTPSRADLIAALDVAERELDGVDRGMCDGDGCATCAALAAVRKALGRT